MIQRNLPNIPRTANIPKGRNPSVTNITNQASKEEADKILNKIKSGEITKWEQIPEQYRQYFNQSEVNNYVTQASQVANYEKEIGEWKLAQKLVLKGKSWIASDNPSLRKKVREILNDRDGAIEKQLNELGNKYNLNYIELGKIQNLWKQGKEAQIEIKNTDGNNKYMSHPEQRVSEQIMNYAKTKIGEGIDLWKQSKQTEIQAGNQFMSYAKPKVIKFKEDLNKGNTKEFNKFKEGGWKEDVKNYSKKIYEGLEKINKNQKVKWIKEKWLANKEREIEMGKKIDSYIKPIAKKTWNYINKDYIAETNARNRALKEYKEGTPEYEQKYIEEYSKQKLANDIQNLIIGSLTGVPKINAKQLKSGKSYVYTRQPEINYIEIQNPVIKGGKEDVYSMYRIYGEQRPPKLEWKTSEGIIANKNIKSIPQKYKITQTFKPVKYGEPVEVFSNVKGSKNYQIDRLEGWSDIIDKNELNQLSKENKYLLRNTLTRGKKYIPYENTKQLSKLMSDNREYTLGWVKRRDLGVMNREKGTKGWIDSIKKKEVTGKSTESYDTATSMKLKGETDAYETYTGRTYFRDSTLPRQRLRQKTPYMKGTVRRYKEPIVIDDGISDITIYRPNPSKRTPLSATFQKQEQVLKTAPKPLIKPEKLSKYVLEEEGKSINLKGTELKNGNNNIHSRLSSGIISSNNIRTDNMGNSFNSGYSKAIQDLSQTKTAKAEQSRENTKQFENLVSKNEQKNITKNIEKEVSRYLQRPLTKQEQKLVQKQLQKQLQKITTKNPPRNPPKIIPEKPRNPRGYDGELGFISKSKEKKGAYIPVMITEDGSQIYGNPYETYEEAVNEGAIQTDEEFPNQFMIKKDEVPNYKIRKGRSNAPIYKFENRNGIFYERKKYKKDKGRERSSFNWTNYITSSSKF